jgi:hypothetical protein
MAIPSDQTHGSRDGSGAADHDAPFEFGRLPSATAPYPFSTREYVRLLILRSRMQANVVNADDRENAHPLVFLPDGIWVASAADLLTTRKQ